LISASCVLDPRETVKSELVVVVGEMRSSELIRMVFTKPSLRVDMIASRKIYTRYRKNSSKEMIYNAEPG
jgi:hypothetical protein